MARNKGARPRRASPDRARPSQPALTIDLGAIAAQYPHLRQEVGPAACAAVVKADAYGLGAARVAPALAAAGCREFFVAHLGEAEVVRRVLPKRAAIYVLNGLLAGEEAEFKRGGFIPVLNDLRQVERLGKAGRGARRPLPPPNPVDTGITSHGRHPEP